MGLQEGACPLCGLEEHVTRTVGDGLPVVCQWQIQKTVIVKNAEVMKHDTWSQWDLLQQ
jgi:hypothetical protein